MNGKASRGFSADERALLLSVRGVGPSVLARFEQLGVDSLAALAAADPGALLHAAAAHVGSTCWRNSPQARQAVSAAIEAARRARADAGASQ